ncbi:hypothetical protein ABKN59_008813 [Abortiporus biennis]
MEPTPSYELQTDQELREARRRLLPHEIFWRDHQQWLEESGYMLRPRYRPDWQPSWNINEYARSHEDAIFALIPKIMDATRIADGRIVVLKHVIPELNPQVIEGVQFMHERNIAHRDIMLLNTMMDPNPMFPELYHPEVNDIILHMNQRTFPLKVASKRNTRGSSRIEVSKTFNQRYDARRSLKAPLDR